MQKFLLNIITNSITQYYTQYSILNIITNYSRFKENLKKAKTATTFGEQNMINEHTLVYTSCLINPSY